MVCIYCDKPTRVLNSRLQKKLNQVWRRRQCVSCHAVFTTEEGVDYSKSIMIISGHKGDKPVYFDKNKLIISIYKSCKHRDKPIADATAIAETCITTLIKGTNNGLIEQKKIISVVHDSLSNFDEVAATHYLAFHSQ